MDPKGNAFRLAAGYGVLSLLWIVLSDLVVASFLPENTFLHTAKGFLFVVVSSTILYVVARRIFARQARVNTIREGYLIAERREIGRVVARTLVHDVRNVMSIFRANVDYLRMTNSGEAAEALDDIDGAIDDLEGLIDHLREGSNTTTELTKIDLCDALRLCARVVHADSRFTGVRVDVHAPEDARCHVLGHPVLLRQSIINLLVNAAEAGATSVRIEVNVGDDDVDIHLVDDGPGMPPEVLDRAFEPFFSTKGRGSGLGLVSVKQTVDLHGGSMSLRNRDKRGLIVALSLPTVPTLASDPSGH
jgi:signal transduction histidine kinase